VTRAYILTTACAIACAAFLSTAHAGDKTFTPHHWEHFGGSAVLAVAATDYTQSEWKGFGITLGVGLAKELIDKTQGQYGMFTCKSLAADAIGAAVGAKLGGLTITREDKTTTVAYSTRF